MSQYISKYHNFTDNNALKTNIPLFKNFKQDDVNEGIDILIIGEGDFSYAKCVVETNKNLLNEKGRVVCTTLLPEKNSRENYEDSSKMIEEIEKLGGLCRFSVDGTDIENTLLPHIDPPHLFNRIVFNFPHTSLKKKNKNQELLNHFFKSASKCLKPKISSEIHVPLTAGQGGTGRDILTNANGKKDCWLVDEQAGEYEISMTSVEKYNMNQYPGYNQKNIRDRTFILERSGAPPLLHIYSLAWSSEAAREKLYKRQSDYKEQAMELAKQSIIDQGRKRMRELSGRKYLPEEPNGIWKQFVCLLSEFASKKNWTFESCFTYLNDEILDVRNSPINHYIIYSTNESGEIIDDLSNMIESLSLVKNFIPENNDDNDKSKILEYIKSNIIIHKKKEESSSNNSYNSIDLSSISGKFQMNDCVRIYEGKNIDELRNDIRNDTESFKGWTGFIEKEQGKELKEQNNEKEKGGKFLLINVEKVLLTFLDHEDIRIVIPVEDHHTKLIEVEEGKVPTAKPWYVYPREVDFSIQLFHQHKDMSKTDCLEECKNITATLNSIARLIFSRTIRKVVFREGYISPDGRRTSNYVFYWDSTGEPLSRNRLKSLNYDFGDVIGSYTDVYARTFNREKDIKYNVLENNAKKRKIEEKEKEGKEKEGKEKEIS